jgi:GAF domain-containing protein
MQHDELTGGLDRIRERSAALQHWTPEQRERFDRQSQQRSVDHQVRRTRAALLREARQRGGTDAAVLFDADFLAVADEPAVFDAIVLAARSTADACDLQLFDQQVGALVIRAHQGFSPAFLGAFRAVTVGDPSACAVALSTARPVLVDDVTSSPIFAGQPSLDALLDAGTRSVASYPLRAADGSVFGVLSFHHDRRRPAFTDHESAVARGAAAALARVSLGTRSFPDGAGPR